jgi:GWxTD domain-containing protein
MKTLLTVMLLSGIVFVASDRAEGIPREKKLVARLTPGETREYYGLQYILGDTKKMEYLSLRTPRERAQWLERFWLEVDPTPTTAENEARTEHEQRVETARSFFGIEREPGWDDRVEIFIRFGPPTFRTREMGDVTTAGLTMPKEFWYYEALNMSVTFTDISLQGRFTCAAPQKVPRIPGPVGWGRGAPFTPSTPDYIAVGRTRELFSRHQPDRLWELEGMKAKDADENFGIYSEVYAAIYTCDVAWRTLPLYFDVTSFRGGDWSDRIDVSFEIPANVLKTGTGGERPGDEVELRVLVRDDSLREVASGEDRINLTASGDALANAPLLPAQIVLALEPGRYTIGIEAREKSSNRRAAFRRTLDLPAYTGSPSISDIQFASSIEETEESRRFVKGNLRIVPHPLRAYRIPHPVIFYFEIYGLSADEEGSVSYKIEYTIVPLEKRRWGPVLKHVPMTISSAFETSGFGSMQPQRLSIATSELWKGPFRLDVKVTDRMTLRTAAQTATFSLVD